MMRHIAANLVRQLQVLGQRSVDNVLEPKNAHTDWWRKLGWRWRKRSKFGCRLGKGLFVDYGGQTVNVHGVTVVQQWFWRNVIVGDRWNDGLRQARCQRRRRWQCFKFVRECLLNDGVKRCVDRFQFASGHRSLETFDNAFESVDKIMELARRGGVVGITV